MNTRPEAPVRTRSRRARSRAAAFKKDERPLVAFDWSFSRIHVTFDGETVTALDGIADLVSLLEAPHKLVAESTFECWDSERRLRLLEQIRDAGHELYVFRPLRTARARQAWDIRKSHEADARVIFRIADQAPTHVYRAIAVPNAAEVAQREELNATYNMLRIEGGKADLVAHAKAILGPHKELKKTRPLLAVALGATDYTDTALAAPFFVAQHARSRDEFERLLGMSASARPSLLRSEIHNHVWRRVAKREFTDPVTGEQRVLTMSEFRRELRSLYGIFKAARSVPAGV